jgi:hypothetical protein
MRRSPNPWPIGLREPNPAGVRETRAVAVMVSHSEEVGSGYANAGGEPISGDIGSAGGGTGLFPVTPSLGQNEH